MTESRFAILISSYSLLSLFLKVLSIKIIFLVMTFNLTVFQPSSNLTPLGFIIIHAT